MSSGTDTGAPQDAGNHDHAHDHDHDHREADDVFYTNDDIRILHEIVSLAQELLPTLPERERLPTNALFGAYYETLPKIGLDADHDNRYARILFKIGGLGGAATLYERFEAVLGRMGIDIEFSNEDEEGEVYDPVEGTIPDLERAHAEDDEDNHPSERRRRNSESTLWDLEQRLPRTTPRRRNSFSILAQPSATPHPSRWQSIAESSPLIPPYRRGRAAESVFDEEDLSARNVRAWLASRAEEPQRRRDRSASTHRSYKKVPIRRGQPSQPGHRPSTRNRSISSDELLAPSEITAVTSALEEQLAGHPSDHTLLQLMDVKALIFRQQYLRTLSGRIVRLWWQLTQQAREGRQKDDEVAKDQYKEVLLDNVLSIWRERAHIKRQKHEERAIAKDGAGVGDVETQTFFADLEKRTEKLRDQNLLRKAFTHWAASSRDKVERTALARRHIVRWRTFTQWRELTVVKAMMARRQMTQKFFSLWQTRHENVLVDEGKAIQKYEENLIERIFRQWMAKARDIQASKWCDDGLKMRLLRRWREGLQAARERAAKADSERSRQLLSRGLRAWMPRIPEREAQEQQAQNLYESRNPPLVRKLLILWVNRTRQARYAAAVDRERMLREALTLWRYNLRLKTIKERVDDRVVSQAMYLWSLAERKRKAREQFDKRLKVDCLRLWAQKCRLAREEKSKREEIAHGFVARKVQGEELRILSLWNNRTKHETETRQEQYSTFLRYYEPRIVRATLDEWISRSQQRQQYTLVLEQKAATAEVKFAASKFIDLWRNALESARREKRKAAYGQVRRTIKMNLAREALRNWRQQARLVVDNNNQALQMKQNKDVIIGMNIFDKWRARTEELGELEPLYREWVFGRQLAAWRNRLSMVRDDEVEARMTHQETQLRRAIKQWSVRSLQQKSQDHYAAEIREKNIKRTFRRTFTYWHQRTAELRPLKPPDPEAYPDLDMMGSTPRAEAWSEFGWEPGTVERGSDIPPVTPLPGYLSTPSRRTARLTASAPRFSTTTPRAPLSTPFERQLRAQYSGGPVTFPRKGPGRSKLGMSEGFADIGGRRNNEEGEEKKKLP